MNRKNSIIDCISYKAQIQWYIKLLFNSNNGWVEKKKEKKEKKTFVWEEWINSFNLRELIKQVRIL